MGKALEGAVMLAGAIGMGAVAFFDPFILATPFYAQAMFALAMGGLSMEAGAIADALTANRGQNITTRQPASYRQVIYGTQRVGGIQIYQSTTGSKKNQYNLVIVLATHECAGIVNLYLDGRQVYWKGSGNGWTVSPGGIGFGGEPDGNDHYGPDGTKYNFSTTDLYCEARYGNQVAGDVITGLTANDGNWAATDQGSPYVGGCTYVYLKLEYNANNFPQFPEIRFTVKGKPVYDPRTGETAYSSNPALIINDIIVDPNYELNDSTVNQDQLIAAANICDEQVLCAALGADESRYSASWHYDTSTGAGDAIKQFLEAMAGRISRIGGEWYVFPGVAVTPVLSFGPQHLIGKNPMQWTPYRPARELYNQIHGTYTAPNYPFNVAGDAYDGNGFDSDGKLQNNFGYAFQPTDFPDFACDTNHGFAADQYLAQDGNVRLIQNLGLPAVLSVSQAQRIASINLLRHRCQGTGTLQMSMVAYQLQPCDVFTMTFPTVSGDVVTKLLEVNSVKLLTQTELGQSPQISLEIGVNEWAASIYDWDADVEEQTVYAVPAVATQVDTTPAAPTDVALASVISTQPDGSLVHELQVTWDTPLDIRVTQIQVQYQVSTASTWTDAGTVSVASNTALLPVVSGLTYNVQIRSIRASGATSVWVGASLLAPLALAATVTQGSGIANSALSVSGSTVTVSAFTTTVGATSVSYYPSGTTVSGVVADATNYVYTVDPTLAGGSPTAYITTNQADYLGKVGYVLLGTVSTATTTNNTTVAQPFAAAPTGTIDGTNASFTVPSSPAVLLLYRNGVFQTSGYTLSGTTLTFATVPVVGDQLWAVGIPVLS